MTPCVNCGRNLTTRTICDRCRESFPGPVGVLDELVETFKDLHARAGGYPGAGSLEPTIKTCAKCAQKNRVPLGKIGRCGTCRELLV